METKNKIQVRDLLKSALIQYLNLKRPELHVEAKKPLD